MGYLWALSSVLLVSVAQLTLKLAMSQLPPFTHLLLFLQALLHQPIATLTLIGGLTGYILSMACWYLALRQLPLSRAYALLSLSYALVWLVAGSLPGLQENYSLRGLLGLLAIIAGVLLIVSSQQRQQNQPNE